MKRLEDMPIGQRSMVTVAVLVMVVLLLALFGYLSGGWDAEGQTHQSCVDAKTRDLIRELSLDAIDDSFKKHVVLLFDIWVKDPAEQPKRAKNGMQAAISAYVRARGDAMKWEPTICE
jgi:hypothetical protein